MPLVQEAAQAHYWREKGAIRNLYDVAELTPLTKRAVDSWANATQQVDNFNIRESYKKEGS